MEATPAKKGRRDRLEEAAAAPAADAGAAEPAPLGNKEYLEEPKKLHVQRVKLQQWVVHEGLKVCIVFEGRDGAGKGGTIRAITERVSPRVVRAGALPAPTERERSQMELQRHLPHMPAESEVAIFDRSWYNRGGVGPVMGLCTDEQADDRRRRRPELAPAVHAARRPTGASSIRSTASSGCSSACSRCRPSPAR
jgi:polyphosphate kinase 2 (PPK2 family)